MATTISIGLVQLCSGKQVDENLRMAEALMETAVQRGAQVIALPENFSMMGEASEKLAAAEAALAGPGSQFLQAFAARHGVCIVGGSIPLKTSNPSKVTNTCLVFDSSGRMIARYDKMHLFKLEYDAENTFDESRYIEPGKELVIFEHLGVRMGLSICYDLRFPELYRALGKKGAEVVFVPSAFTVPTGRDHWEVLLRARAIENQCYVVAPAQFGVHDGQRKTYGRSMIVDPWGQVIAQCPDREAVVVGEVDLDYLREVRAKLPALQGRQPELFGEKIGK